MKPFFLALLGISCLFYGVSAQLKGIYSIDPSKPASAVNFLSIHAAVDSLTKNGISDSVNFEIADGAYQDSIYVDSASAPGLTNNKFRIVFESAKKDSSKVIVSTKASTTMFLRKVGMFTFRGFTFASHDSILVYLSNADNLHFENCVFTGGGNNPELISIMNFHPVQTNNIYFNHCRFLSAMEGLHLDVVDNYYYNSRQPGGNVSINHSVFENISGLSLDVNEFTIKAERNELGSIGIYNNYIYAPSYINYNRIKGNLGFYQCSASIINNFIHGGLENDGSVAYLYYNTIIDFANVYIGQGAENSTFYGTNNIFVKGTNVTDVWGDDDSYSFFSVKYSCYPPGVFSDGFYGLERYKIQSTEDSGSIVADPQFVDTTNNDFHIRNIALRKGIPVQGITDDIDGNPRNPIRPCIGASELPFLHNEVGIKAKDACTGMPVQFKDTSFIATGETIQKWSWDFGDGTTSALQNPEHTYSLGGRYNVKLKITSATGDTSTISDSIFIDNDCVHPGDVNKDGVVDGKDVLCIAMANNGYGPSREVADYISSSPLQPCRPWKQTFPSGVNFKHADCDGDGLIWSGYGARRSYELETLERNYTMTPVPFSVTQGKPTDPPLYIVFQKQSYNAFDFAYADVYIGSRDIPFKGVLGVAFSILFPTDIVDTSNITFHLSDSNLFIYPGIHTNHKKSNAQWDFVFADAWKSNDTGYWKLMTLKLPLWKPQPNRNNILKLSIGNNTQINTLGDYVPFFITDTPAVVIDESHSGNDASVYPNPTNGILYIATGGDDVNSYFLYTMEGKQMLANTNSQKNLIELQLGFLPNGMYILRLNTIDGIKQQKISVMK